MSNSNERKGFLKGIPNNLKFKFTEEPSEDTAFFLAEGHIEKLVREGRVPLQIGTIGHDAAGNGMPFYQVPPPGYNPEEIDQVFMSAGGAYAFVKKDGTIKVGPTYSLTPEQSAELESRINSEKERLGIK